MPDFKFWDAAWSERLCRAPDYPEKARAALKEMYRQVGDLTLDAGGIAVRGLLVRHLVMPNGVSGTDEVMRFIAEEISPDTYVNVMSQYRPCGRAIEEKAISRSVNAGEFEKALRAAREAGLHRFAS
jgi:putative pyruvate formate lyase activating enzyme